MPVRAEGMAVRGAELIAWAALLVCLRHLFGLFEVGFLDAFSNFNGDTLFLADVTRDFRTGGSFSDWNFPHALYLVPDLVLWLVALLFTSTVHKTMVLFGVLAVLAGAALVRTMLRPRGIAAAAVAPAAFCLVFAFISRGELREALDLVRPMHHWGVALLGFVGMLGLSAWFWRPSWGRFVGLAALLFLACLSDPFSLTCVAAPLAAVPVLVALRTSVGRLRNLAAGVLLGVAGAGGNLAARALTSVGSDLGTIDPARLPGQWAVLRRSLETLQWTAPDVLFVIAIALLPVLFVRGVKNLRSPALGPVLDVVPLMALVANELSLMLTGNIVHVLFNRYHIVLFAYLLLTLARAAAAFSRWPRLLAAAVVLVSVGSAYFMAGKLEGKPRRPFTQWQLPGAECVVREARARGAQRGMADVLAARPLTMLNESGIRFDPMENAEPRWWLATRRSFADLEPPVGFIVLSHLNHPSVVQARFGPPSELVQCPPLQVWFWAPEQRAEVTRRLASLPVRPKQ